MDFVCGPAKSVLVIAGWRALVWAGVLWLAVLSAMAQDDTPVFVAPARPLVAGIRGGLWLYCVNSSSNPVSRAFAPVLGGTLAGPGAATPVRLDCDTNHSPANVVIAPGGFARVQYFWEVPVLPAGSYQLAVSNCNAVVVPVVAPVGQVPLAGASPSAPVAPPASSAAAYMGFVTNHLSTYEPIYFILGTYPAAKFQFSIKYRVFNLTNDDNPIGHFYFAYTQTSFWDLLNQDPSFYDTSYKPSAFLLYNDVLTREGFHLDLQGGMEHESNGQGGTAERSLNTIYLQPTATFDLPNNLAWRLQPRVWDYLSLGQYNQNMPTYRGYVDLLTDLTWSDPRSEERIQMAVKARMGNDWEHEGWWFTARFNLAGVPGLRVFTPTIQLEYFTGFGQTLRQYNASSHGFRAGLCLFY